MGSRSRQSTGPDEKAAPRTKPETSMPRRGFSWGRPFVNSLFDVGLIGGGLSLAFIPLAYLLNLSNEDAALGLFPWFILLSNSSHFAASTVRLYSKEGTRAALPFITMGLPLVTFLLLILSLMAADEIGSYVQLLYLTWSPYHYSAQAYGIAMLYAYRSGCIMNPTQKRLLWSCALLPFLLVVLHTVDKHIIPWLMPHEPWIGDPRLVATLSAVAAGVSLLSIAGPLAFFFFTWRSDSGPLPLISLLAVMANAIWFVLFPAIEGVLWVTVFHGVQYLAIVMIFHVREQMARPGNRHGAAWHVARFYSMCLLLGYGLFSCWPWFFRLLGFGYPESLLMVIAAINIHHFVVDAYIWRLRPGDSNRRVVESSELAPA
jgi:hypothetical protein